jgi:beta-glucosidase
VPALVETWYAGQEAGTALGELLVGAFSPSGKLPATFERRWEDSAVYKSYYPMAPAGQKSEAAGDKKVIYSEGIFVGYRHFDRSGRKPLFPFGYGLSYTRFKLGALAVTPDTLDGDGPITVAFDVTNVGQREGAEVAQVYVGDKHAPVPRPPKELKGFVKVSLKAGETKRAQVTLNRRAFSYYDVVSKQWTAAPGEFEILVGTSSQQIDLRSQVQVHAQLHGN